MSNSHIYVTCRECASCHCHDCVMQEREVKRQAIQALVDEFEQERRELQDRIVGAGQERYRLRAALEKYGQHTERCCIPIVPDGPECTCGLSEALDERAH